MNNKGFAVSTVIYGLSIMGMMLIMILMGTIASNRTNTSKLVETIENELVGYSKVIVSFSSKADNSTDKLPVAQEYIVPEGESGWYRIELWGAAGGKSGSSYNGGKGAYVSGIIELNAGDTLYFYVGNSTVNGGRETDVRYKNGSYTASDSLNSRLMVAAGGGKNAQANGGTLIGYKYDFVPHVGIVNTKDDYGLATADGDFQSTTLVGYPKDKTISSSVKTEGCSTSGLVASSVGGDGYCRSTTADTGGSSYIVGSAGSGNGVKINGEVYDEESGTTSTQLLHNYYFVDSLMFEGVNTGEGKARVQRVLEKNETVSSLPRKNTKFNGVRYIEDCVGELSGANINNVKIVAMAGGVKQGSDSYSTSGNCKKLDIGSVVNLDEIAVWHKAGIDFKNNTVKVSSDNSTWKYIKETGSATSLSETETPFGYRYSAYQFDSTQKIPDKGNYYIIPVLTENRALSAKTISSDDTKVEADYFQGGENQKWSIELITDPKLKVEGKSEYKIIELQNNRALSIAQDENISLNDISAGRSFNAAARNEPQIWTITAVKNDTYVISSTLNSSDVDSNSGNIFPLRKKPEFSKPSFVIGKNNRTTQRFKIISVDYSSS